MTDSPHFIGRSLHGTGCTKFVKILDRSGEPEYQRSAGARTSDSGAAPARSLNATLITMTQPPAPKIQLSQTPDYRENYANSVQVRVNLWDFLLLFGRVNQTAPESVAIQNFQGIYVSPQQAKALLNVLQQNVTQYETAFGEIRLEPQNAGGIVQ
jgi:Protein of unknown function (DUF3467)